MLSGLMKGHPHDVAGLGLSGLRSIVEGEALDRRVLPPPIAQPVVQAHRVVVVLLDRQRDLTCNCGRLTPSPPS